MLKYCIDGMENKIVVIAITAILMIATTAQAYATNNKQDTAWNDGARDCALGYSYWIDQHSNAGHHSAQYMSTYNQAFNSCNGPIQNNIHETSHNQAQSANPQVTCSVLIGTCNTGQKTNQAQEDNSSD